MSILAVPVASAATVPWDDPSAPAQQPFLTGYLLVQGTTQRVVWDPSLVGQDDLPADPSPGDEASQGALFSAERHLNSNNLGSRNCRNCPTHNEVTSGTRLVDPPPSDEFVSDPLPVDAHLNVTRGFQFTLYLRDHKDHPDPCRNKADGSIPNGPRAVWLEPHLEVELRAGHRLVGGAYPTDAPAWHLVHPARARPADPDGYGACHYQMHPETAFLAQGTILRLSIHHAMQQFHYPYGLAGDHRSQLRIWLYPAEELYYRHPELAPAAADEEAPATAGISFVAGVFSLVGVLGPRRRAVALAALVASIGFAGCFAPSARPDATGTRDGVEGRVESTLVKDAEVPDAPTGSIRGLVHDDLHVAIPGVHVSPLGRSDFTQTDGKGRFSFVDLAPGAYRLRFDKEEYRSFEAEVEVRAGFVTRPDITLYLVNAKVRDLRPHSHDYWQGDAKRSIGEVVLEPECPAWGNDPCTLEDKFRLRPAAGDPHTVIPGTSEVEVALSWDRAALGADRLGLAVASLQGNMSVFAPRGPGEPFRIQTTWEMTDVGHIPYSSWVFYWFIPGTEARTWQEERDQREAGHNPGSITLRGTIHRGGVLPLEPPHPDHWKGKNELEVVKEWRGHIYMPTLMPPGEWTCVEAYLDCYNPEYEVLDFGQRLVPEGTKWVEVTLKRTRAANPSFDVVLRYKPANVPFHMSDPWTAAGFKAADPVAGGSLGKTVYRIPVTEAEADYAYALRSLWQLTFRPTSEEAAWQDWWTWSYAGGLLGDPWLEFIFSVRAHRDPMPT